MEVKHVSEGELQCSVTFLRKDIKLVKQAYHFVGIGGCGMSGLALILARWGHQVTGSDLQSSSVVDRLERRGVHVCIGHIEEAVPDNTACMVVSAAVPSDNPEWQWARRHGVRVIKYAEMLGELSRQINTIAISGTHGKSTTSGWLAYVLQQAGLDPSFVIGADVEQLGGGSGAGMGDYLVVEACEYDRSFLNLRPAVGVILNIEADHLDYYRDEDDIIDAFSDFAALIHEDGLLIYNGRDENTRRAIASCGLARESFGFAPSSDWQAQNLEFERGQGCFNLVHRGKDLGRVNLSLAGRHNVANALAVAAAAWAAGVPREKICSGLENFVGAGRRMTCKGTVQGVIVVDDYAHHPTEIRATLSAIRARYRPERLWCVFQPHQHSRTRFFLHEFASSFQEADIILLPDIYFVRESEQLKQEVNASQLAEEINRRDVLARYLGDFETIIEVLRRDVREGDVVVTMGAGDVWKVADELICRLGRNS